MSAILHTNDCVRQRARFGARSKTGEVCSCGGIEPKARPSSELPEIVKRALAETITDIGQLSKPEIYQLNKYVKRGWLSKGKGGPFPILKTVYACPGFDFEASRTRYVERAMALAELDKAAKDCSWLRLRQATLTSSEQRSCE